MLLSLLWGPMPMLVSAPALAQAMAMSMPFRGARVDYARSQSPLEGTQSRKELPNGRGQFKTCYAHLRLHSDVRSHSHGANEDTNVWERRTHRGARFDRRQHQGEHRRGSRPLSSMTNLSLTSFGFRDAGGRGSVRAKRRRMKLQLYLKLCARVLPRAEGERGWLFLRWARPRTAAVSESGHRGRRGRRLRSAGVP
jgi:hypothetical protein